MKTLSSLFSYWKLAGYEIQMTMIYKDKARIIDGPHYNGSAVYHTIVNRSNVGFCDRAHIIHRVSAAGDVLGMISADLHFGDDTLFIKNAKLSTLVEYMN